MYFRRLAWGLLLSLFFVSTLVLSWPTSRALFVSPDEHAAFIFAEQFAHTGKFWIDEPLNTELGGILHPRSTTGFGDGIVPASFVGFILVLGVVGGVFGKFAMFLVTPLVAILTLWLWRDSVKRVFHDPVLADLAAFLLMIHPAFWYYTGRVMMHNVAFLGLLVAGVWWCLTQPLTMHRGRHNRALAHGLDFVLAGMLFGAALVVRTSEIFWLTAAIASVFVVYRKAIGWRALSSFVAGYVLMLGVLALLNWSTYGAPLTNGYTAQYPYAAVVISDQTSSAAIDEPHRNLLLPFGFHERVIWFNVTNYGWRLYPWMSVIALVGMGMVLVDKSSNKRVWRGVLMFTLVLATWFAVMYGSWKIIDNPDPSIISLGNSHVRYWLPLFALASVFGAKTLRYLFGDGSRLRLVQVTGLAILLTLLSGQLVFFGEDGFVPSLQALKSFAVKREAILASTEDDAIVVVDRADKYVFPDRRVIVPLRSESTYAALPTMLEYAPVYYFGITLPAVDLEYLNTQKLVGAKVQIEYLETIGDESLYKFILLP